MDTGKVRASLEQQGMTITSAGLEFFPRTLLSLDEDNLNAASMLIETLTDCPDVVRVWDNIQADSWTRCLDTWWTEYLKCGVSDIAEEGFINRCTVLLTAHCYQCGNTSVVLVKIS